MDLGIEGKCAIVGGGSRGCGLGVAQALAAEGAHVLLTGRDQAHVDAAVKSILDAGGTATGMVADMTVPGDAARVADTARTTFGPPTILVINPRPASQARGFENASDDDFRDANETWVMSLVYLARQVLPDMKAANWGRIVYLGSIGMKVLHLDDPMYAQNVRVAAAGVMKTLAHEYGKYGITANTIATGPFMSGLSLDYIAGGGLDEDQMLAMTASGRWGRPDEMGSVVASLCSALASFVTGETIRVDSGYTHSLF